MLEGMDVPLKMTQVRAKMRLEAKLKSPQCIVFASMVPAPFDHSKIARDISYVIDSIADHCFSIRTILGDGRG